MPIPCVVLASGPRKGVNWDQFDEQLCKFVPGPQMDACNDYRVFFKVAGTQDGGNGGGGEPSSEHEMFPVLGVRRKCAWDFQQYPANVDWDERFPHAMRFELCLDFPDISYASNFLRNDKLGRQVSSNFTTVMIVALSRRPA